MRRGTFAWVYTPRSGTYTGIGQLFHRVLHPLPFHLLLRGRGQVTVVWKHIIQRLLYTIIPNDNVIPHGKTFLGQINDNHNATDTSTPTVNKWSRVSTQQTNHKQSTTHRLALPAPPISRHHHRRRHRFLDQWD